jgi:hypothetical protein
MTYTHVISTVWITYTRVFRQLSGFDTRTTDDAYRQRIVINRPATISEKPIRKFHELSSAIQCRT